MRFNYWQLKCKQINELIRNYNKKINKKLKLSQWDGNIAIDFFYFYWGSYHQFLHTTQNGDSNLFSDLGYYPKQFIFLTNVKTICTYPAQRASAILAFKACFSWQISRFLHSLYFTHSSNWNHTYSLLFNSKSYSISCIAAQNGSNSKLN